MSGDFYFYKILIELDMKAASGYFPLILKFAPRRNFGGNTILVWRSCEKNLLSGSGDLDVGLNSF